MALTSTTDDTRMLSSGVPYLPHPFPLQRHGRVTGSHSGGFVSLHDPCKPCHNPEKRCCPEKVFVSYGEWWQAHQPPVGPPPPDPDVREFSTNFWPYGRRISAITSTDNHKDIYELDRRIIRQNVPHIRRSASVPFTGGPMQDGAHFRSTGRAELHGSHSEAVVGSEALRHPSGRWEQGSGHRENYGEAFQRTEKEKAMAAAGAVGSRPPNEAMDRSGSMPNLGRTASSTMSSPLQQKRGCRKTQEARGPAEAYQQGSTATRLYPEHRLGGFARPVGPTAQWVPPSEGQSPLASQKLGPGAPSRGA